MNKKFVFHLLANAHLDPVWLWDWREGLNEGIATCRTMENLLTSWKVMASECEDAGLESCAAAVGYGCDRNYPRGWKACNKNATGTMEDL